MVVSSWIKRHLAELFLGTAIVLGLLSSIQQLTGTSGGLLVGLAAILVAVVGVLAFIYTKNRQKSIYRRISLREALVEFGPKVDHIDAVFSAADQLRQAVESGALNSEAARLQAGLKLRLVSRRRSGPDQISVRERIDRLDTRLRSIGISFEHREAEWEFFMIGGLIFGEVAIVKFYYRRDNTTHTLSDDYLVVRKGYGLEDMYFRALAAAFEALWIAP